MRVELSSDLFPEPPSSVQLYAIAELALAERHRLLIQNDQDPRFVAWLDNLSTQDRDEWDLILLEAITSEAREPADRCICVVREGSPDWEAPRPTVPLSEALVFLRSPLLAFLEDWRSDRAFLLAVAQPAQRTYLEKMESRGAIQFSNGGGISNMPGQIRAAAETPGGRWRLWAMYDSDALFPNEPSADSRRLHQACSEANIPHHQLHRRAIENYLTPEQIEKWANIAGNGRPARMRKYRAFARMNASQRSHFNMKDGFAQDAKRSDASAGKLYDGVLPQSKEFLSEGFGDNIANLFASSPPSQRDLQNDGSWAELSSIVANLVRWAR